MLKGIRGAITVDNNSEDSIKSATIELMSELVKVNNITENDISHVIFTMTKDLNKAYPAKFVRVDMGFKNTAIMCFNELDIENSLPMCLRILIVTNCEKTFSPQFIYLKDASNLRK